MTDNEIIKALEYCVKNDLAYCKICPYYEAGHWCRSIPQNDILNLLNRQKATIESLKEKVKEKDDTLNYILSKH